jgi:hypothetical protein
MKYARIIRRNGVVVGRIEPSDQPSAATETTCPYRGPQLRTITSVICKKKTIDLPVYDCGLFGGECVHRQVCEHHDQAIRICVGCRREI